MNQDKLQIFTTLSMGMAAIWMLADLGGLWVCLWHRKLSNWLILAGVGFGGLFLSTAISRFASLARSDFFDLMYLVYLLASIMGCLSTTMLVFGLGAALVDIRRKLSKALDHYYGQP